ncbi:MULTISPECIES: NUDIX domain-containing protein [Altererythrobacter]|uniref:ADP-ribose pyrophosphatase YjhB (NUDIX family) n=1 Tax=Altererythrobacter ishigakiensis TaxID=476157 RepID=A0A562UTQ4_9SPHN|nr:MULTISPECIES: NUDIX domain-containing protein [Altererythrobacter]MBO6609021.1 NUDIX domain-containing protein [Altererythrobacter sp.]MBO6642560.1 NUDIX domain-containing protein [Altererythrobacter sp.]MBO6708932.1 NUDIX domain-containing protein [Altererythrobacter sp.]MBO6944959.1 NUDIX domain-containing protein [Altererythrobacter sp.]MDX1703515.1 NUDIX domain-containing protein [Altererythrobacter ishigakiensis]
MLRLIERLTPRPLHRAALRVAFRVRHHWRSVRKAPIAGCNVVITDLKGEILMVRHSYGPAGWSLPGGGVKRGEDPAAAVSRELEEELGFSNALPKPVGELHNVISGSAHTMYLFELKVDKNPRPDRREVIEARFYPPQSLPEPMSSITRLQLDYWRSHKG